MVKLIFWFSFFIIFYAYFGYLLMLLLLSFFKKRKFSKKPFEPTVSLIIPVHNGERMISDKLKNTLSLEYPRVKLEIIVSSDGSTDQTNPIIRRFEDQEIKLVALPQRQGKAAALNKGLEVSKGEIIVFSDVSIMLEKDSLRQIVQNFASDQIGCVSGEDHIISTDGGEGLYGKYELFLRRLESSLSSIVGASGCFYAQRRDLIDPFPVGMAPDFFSVLNVIKKGYLAISDQEAKGVMSSISTAGEEFPRKIRTILRGMTTLFHQRALLNPFRYPFFSFQLLSHKVIRWSVPFFMVIMFVTNLFLMKEWFYSLLLMLQIVFYGLAVFGLLWSEGIHVSRVFRFPSYFFLSNMATLFAWIKYFLGERQEIWKPSGRA